MLHAGGGIDSRGKKIRRRESLIPYRFGRSKQQDVAPGTRSAGTASTEEFSALYNQKAVYTSQMKAIEDRARDAAGVVAAEQQWRQASAALETLSAQQKAAVEADPSVVQAKRQVEVARDNLDKANAQWARAQAQFDEQRYQESRQDYQNQVNADLIQRFGGDDDNHYSNTGYIRGVWRRR